MTAPAVTTRRFPTSSGRRGKAEPDARALVTAIRSSGFDLRRTMFVTFVVSVGDSRDAAFAMLHTDRQARWHTSLYGDDSGWVVRVSHSCRLTADKLTACLLRVNGLAAAGGGSVREVTVEDLRADDCWAAMAERVRRTSSPAVAAGELPGATTQPITPIPSPRSHTA